MKDRRKTVIHLVEKDEMLNLRILSEIIARKIKNGGVKL